MPLASLGGHSTRSRPAARAAEYAQNGEVGIGFHGKGHQRFVSACFGYRSKAFADDARVAVAFAVWNGTKGDHAGVKLVSGWHWLDLGAAEGVER